MLWRVAPYSIPISGMAGLGNEIQCSREELLAVIRHWKTHAVDGDPHHVPVDKFQKLVRPGIPAPHSIRHTPRSILSFYS